MLSSSFLWFLTSNGWTDTGTVTSLVLYGVLMFFGIALIFQMKHALCDYFFQTDKMVAGKGADANWVIPLAQHSLCHAVYTFLVCLLVWSVGKYVVDGQWSVIGYQVAYAALLALIDFVVHFLIDRIKARYSKGKSVTDSRFWQALGLDQAAHHVTHYFLILAIIYMWIYSGRFFGA